MYEVHEIKNILEIAKQAAIEASDAAHEKYGDFGACGFSWVNIYGLDGVEAKGNNKVGRALKKAGVGQNYQRVFQIWNCWYRKGQSVDNSEAGARAFAKVLKNYGFDASAGSRLD